MEGFSFVTPVTGLNRPDTGMEEEYDDDDGILSDTLCIVTEILRQQ
jgi:hypothetical protein